MGYKDLRKHEVETLMRDITDICRDVGGYSSVYPSTIKTCETLLSNMKYYCSKEWEDFAKDQNIV